MHHCGISDYAQVATLAGNSRLAQRYDVFLGGNVVFDSPIKILVLEENHRIVVANSGLDKTFRIVGARGTNHFQTRSMHKPHLRILRVKRTAVDVSTTRSANHQWRRRIPAIVRLGQHVYDLVESAADEVHELKLSHRPHAGKRSPIGRANDSGFSNGR